MTTLATMSVHEARAAGHSRRAWLDAVRPVRPSRPVPQPQRAPRPKHPPFSANYPCAFRGSKTGTTPCRTCGSRTENVDVHGCSKHGKCTIKTLPRERGISTCQVCPDRQTFREEVPFASYMDQYAGRTGWVIGAGPTQYDYRDLGDVHDPVFTINNWAWVQQYVMHDDQFWFALDSVCQSWLPDLRGTAVLDLNENGGGGSAWGKDRKSAYLVGGRKMCFWQSTPGMGANGVNFESNQQWLEQTKEELQASRRLYRYRLTIIPLLHFAWYAGFSHLNLVGCKGDSKPEQMYDTRGLPFIRTGNPRYRNYGGIREEQDRILAKLGVTATYFD